MNRSSPIRSLATHGWLLAIALSLGAPLGAQVWSGPAGLEVRVDDERGRAVEGAEVVLSYGDETERPAPVLTDRKGRAEIGGLAGGVWSIEVRHQGHMTFRATILLAADEKPEIESAAQHNVPGAVAPMRVRLGRAKNAPPARPLVQTVAPPPPPTQPVATPTAPPPPPRSAATPAPAPPSQPVAAPTAAPTPPRSAATPAPAPPTQPVATPTAPPPPPRSAATPEPPPPSQPVATPAAAPQPPPSATTPAPAPLVPPALTPPVQRTCYECGPGEQALYTEVRMESGGGCGEDLRARLSSADAAELAGILASPRPAGCAVLRVEVPKGNRYLGFRYEAGAPGARSADCFPDRPCAAGGCRFVGDPILKREGETTTVLAIFELDGEQPRTGGLTVYYAAGRRR